MICIKWASAAHLLRQNLKDHKRRLQNHAFKAFLDHSVDGYWIWDIENDDIEWSERTREMVGVKKTASHATFVNSLNWWCLALTPPLIKWGI